MEVFGGNACQPAKSYYSHARYLPEYCCVFFLFNVFFGKKSGMLISGTLMSGILMSGMLISGMLISGMLISGKLSGKLMSGTLISGKSGICMLMSRDRFPRDADIADPATVEV